MTGYIDCPLGLGRLVARQAHDLTSCARVAFARIQDRTPLAPLLVPASAALIPLRSLCSLRSSSLATAPADCPSHTRVTVYSLNAVVSGDFGIFLAFPFLVTPMVRHPLEDEISRNQRLLAVLIPCIALFDRPEHRFFEFLKLDIPGIAYPL